MKKSKVLTQPVQTKLRHGKRKQAIESIASQIEKGQLLQEKYRSINLFSSNALNEIKSEDNRWLEYTKQLLDTFFTTNDEKKRFVGFPNLQARYISSWIPNQNSIHQELNDLQDNLSKRVNALLSLQERLPLFEEEETNLLDNEQTETNPKSRERREPISVIVNTTNHINNSSSNWNSNQANQTTSTVTENDLSGLLNFLKSKGIHDNDTSQLKTAIENDGKLTEGKLGSNIRKWVGDMVIKAHEKIWNMSTDIAATLLLSAIHAFYGLGI